MFPSSTVPNAADRLYCPVELAVVIETSPCLSGIDNASLFLTHVKYIQWQRGGINGGEKQFSAS